MIPWFLFPVLLVGLSYGVVFAVRGLWLWFNWREDQREYRVLARRDRENR